MRLGSISLKLISLTICGACFVACGDEDDDSSGPHADAKSLTLGDFELSNLTEVYSAEVREEMEDFDWHENKAEGNFSMLRLHAGTTSLGLTSFGLKPFGLTQADNEEDGEHFTDFMNCAFDDESAVLRAEGDRFTWDFSTPDFGKCMVAMMGSFLENAQSNMAFSGYVTQSCPGADYSALDGLKFSDFLDPAKLAEVMQGLDTETLGGCDLTNNSIGFQFKMEMAGSLSGDVVFGDQRHSINVIMNAKEATMASDGGDCKFSAKDGVVTVEDCVHRSASSNTSNAGGNQSEERTLMKADTSGTKGSPANEYLTEGEIPVSFNGWTGTVTLDGTARPAYKLAKGGEEVSGQVGDWSSSSSPGSAGGGSSYDPTKDEYEEESPASQYDIPSLNLSANAEVHYIGSYEGDAESTITVDVDRPGAPIILVLASYDSAEYTVNIAEGTTIELVVLAGYHASNVIGLPAEVKVLADFHDRHVSVSSGTYLEAKYPYFYAYFDDSEIVYGSEYKDGSWGCSSKPRQYQEYKWIDAQEAILQITGKEPVTSQGSYSSGAYVLNAETTGHMEAQRQSGYCYKNADGEIVKHGWDGIEL